MRAAAEQVEVSSPQAASARSGFAHTFSRRGEGRRGRSKSTAPAAMLDLKQAERSNAEIHTQRDVGAAGFICWLRDIRPRRV